MQIAFVYWFTTLLKSYEEWRVNHTALYYALSVDEYATPIGAYLYQFPKLLEVMTLATVWFEIIGPFLLFFPFFTGPVRTGAVLAFMSFHFGIWLTMSVGFFPWISAFCMVCFLPSWFWDKVLPKLRAVFPRQRGITRRLQRTVAYLGSSYWSSFWASLRARSSTQTDLERPFESGVVSGEENSSGELLGERGSGKSPAPSRTSAELITLHSSSLTNVVALFFLLCIFLYNLMTIGALTLPTYVVALDEFLGLDQEWNMFDYHTDKGWYVIPGILHGGSQVDLMGVTRGDFRLREVSWEKPESVPSTYKNERWRKYLSRIRSDEYTRQRLYLGRYICREWNSRHTGDEQLETFQVTYMLEEILPDYEPSTPQEEVLWEHSCF